MCVSAPVESSLYKVLAYQNARFNSANLDNVVLIIDSISYPLGTYTNPNVMRNAFVSQLAILGHLDTSPNAPISDIFQVTVDTAGIEFIINFTCMQGFQTRLQLAIDGNLLTPTIPDIGAFVEFVVKADGLSYTDVSTFGLQLDSAVQVENLNSSYSFVPQLLGTTFDNSLTTGDNYELEGEISGFAQNFTATHTDLLEVQSEALLVIRDINAFNGHIHTDTPYISVLTVPDISNAPEVVLYCVETLKVENQNIIIPTTNNSSRKTGFEGNLELIIIDFQQLGYVGNEPLVELQYFLNGQPKAQLFQYNNLTLSYQPI